MGWSSDVPDTVDLLDLCKGVLMARHSVTFRPSTAMVVLAHSILSGDTPAEKRVEFGEALATQILRASGDLPAEGLSVDRPVCPDCGGEGRVDALHPRSSDPQKEVRIVCPHCGGDGREVF